MWSSRSSRTPSHATVAKDKGDVISVLTPLQPSLTSAEDGLTSPAGERGRKKSSSSCLCCCGGGGGGGGGSGKRRHADQKKARGADKKPAKAKNGKGHQAGDRTYFLAAGDGGKQDGTLESGITGLSQLTDIPRYDSDADIEPLPSNPTTTTTSTTTYNDSQQKKTRCQKCGRHVRSCVRVFFSLIGLTIFVTGYAIGGGFLFSYLEKDQELQLRDNMHLLRQRVVQTLWNTTEQLNVLHEQEWKAMADTVLQRFQKDVHVLTHQGWDGMEVGEVATAWTVASSLLFSLTVITTIGYGNITPKTTLGRYTTIGYAIIGIPMFVMWLASTGGLMATAFRFLYKQVCSFCRCICCLSRARRRPPRSRPFPQTLDTAALTEQGHNPAAKLTDKKKAGGGEKRVRVPIFVSLLTLVLYIMLGAVLFSMWEKWEFSVAAYFCFVTLSTIGFGDYVPGFGTDMSQGKAIGNAVYLILGLAILAMCFDLMREEVALTMRKMYDSITSWTSDGQVKSPTARPVEGTRREVEMEVKKEPVFRTRQFHAHTGRSCSAGRDPGAVSGRSLSSLDLQKSAPASHRTSKSMHTLLDADGEDLGYLGPEARRSRLYTVCGAAGRYAPLPQGNADLGGSSGYNNNNKASVNNNNCNVHEEGPQTMVQPRAVSVLPHHLADTVDLLEHMSLLRHSSQPPSPRIQRRDRSRSPVRGRPKSRGAGGEDRGGNVDVATEDEDELDDEDDDEDTLDAESVASSTDLVKVAHAIRRERSQRASPTTPTTPTPTHIPTTTTATTTPTTPTPTSEEALPAFAHPYNNVAMTTFRPSPPGGRDPPGVVVVGAGMGVGMVPCGLIPTTSRPQSRCQSRARSSSPVSRTYYHADDILPPPSYSPSEGEGEGEGGSVYGECGGVGDGEMDFGGAAGSSSPSSMSTRSAFSRPRPPSSVGGRLSEDSYVQLQQQRQQQQQLQQQRQQQRQQQLRQQQRQQQQQYQQQQQLYLQQQQQQQRQQHQQQQQRQAQRQGNKVHSSESDAPPRCVSPTPRPPKTPQHKVAPPSYTSSLQDSKQHPPPPPSTLTKTKKAPVIAQPL